jgi:hypothetical protein
MPRDRVAKRSKVEERMMKQLLVCFRQNTGRRGVTFYDEDSAYFLPWDKTVAFLRELGESTKSDDDTPFEESLLETLSNYDPEKEFLSVRQEGKKVSIELFRLKGKGVKPTKDMW